MAGRDTDLSNTKAGVLIRGLEKYRQALFNLLETPIHGRWFSLFGINLEDSVFEEFTDEEISFDLIIRIDEATKFWIPEITLNLSRSTIESNRERHTYSASLVYEYQGETYEETFELSSDML